MSDEAQTTSSAEEPESASTTNAGLQKQIESLEAATAGLEAALSAGKKTRLVLLLLFVAIVFFTIKGFYGIAMDFQSEENLNEMMTLAQKKLGDSSPEFSKEMQLLVDNATPKITEAFMEQSKKDMPRYAGAIDRERDALVENLRAKLNAQVEKRHEKILKDFEGILAEEFPAAKDKDAHAKMVANFQVALNKLVKKYYADEFESQMKRMYKAYDDFPIAEPVDPGDLPHEDQLIGDLLELATLKLSRRGPQLEAQP